MAFGQRVMMISSLIILLWMGIGVLVYRSYTIKLPSEPSAVVAKPKSPEDDIKYCKASQQKLSPGFWRRFNVKEKAIPQSVKDASSMIIVQSDSVTVLDTKVHYLFAKPATPANNNISVLLLHGQAYTSETWNQLGTIKMLAAFGYYPIAVDLPGYGRTSAIKNVDKGNFLHELISSLKLENPVIVSPSMSGSFSLKYLIEHSEEVAGFIPVSPVGTSVLDVIHCDSVDRDSDMPLNKDCERIMHYIKGDQPKLDCLKVPSLIVFGERDRGANSAKLCLLPKSQGAQIPEGKHAAYRSNPDLWHKLLYNFLNVVSETLGCK